MAHNKKILVICESKKQVELLCEKYDISASNFYVFAANPDASWELHKHGFRFSSIEDFQDNPTSEEIEKLLADQIEWAHRVDSFLDESISKFKDMGFNPARFYLYHLKNVWDTFNHRINVLEKIWDRLHPDKVIYFPNMSLLSFDNDIIPQGSTFAACIPEWAQEHQIDQLVQLSIQKDEFWKVQTDMHLNFLTRIQKVIDLVPVPLYDKIIGVYQTYQHRVFSKYRRESNIINARIAMKKNYDLNNDLCDQLLKKDIYAMPFEIFIIKNSTLKSTINEMKDTLNQSWENVITTEWFWQTGYVHNPIPKSILYPLLKHFWLVIIPRLWQCMMGSNLIIEKERPNAILYSAISGFNNIGFLMAARKKKIPVICYQHGASMGDIENPIWDLLDRILSDYMLVYGTGEYDYLNSRHDHGDFNAIPIPVGSARFDTIVKKSRLDLSITHRKTRVAENNNPTILYVPGIYSNNFYRYTYNMKSIHYFNVRSKIARLFADNSQINFLYKSFISEGTDPTIKMLKEVCPKCRIIDNIQLTDLQWSADVLIHEFPSTAMYEGLLTDKPMIVYSDRNIYRMSSEAKEMLNRRVILTESGDVFIEKIKEFLEGNNFLPLKNPDREFLKRYCTHLDDGQSANRAADVIVNIAKSHQ